MISVFIGRSSELQYHSETSYAGIPGFKYVVADTMLKSVDECFCSDSIIGAIKQDNGCLFYGAMDLYPCLGELKKNLIEITKVIL